MYLRVNEQNEIEISSRDEKPGTVEYTGDVPEDFLSTFSTGKYAFEGGELVENTDWTPPEPSEDLEGDVNGLPEDIPHRSVLVDAGINSISELQDIEDLTTIDGIGPAKAGDINNYLSTNQ